MPQINHIKMQLKHLISEGVEASTVRERATFDTITTPLNHSVVLFGAGNIGRKALKILKKGKIDVCAFADENPALWHKSVDGIKVLPPQEAVHTFGNSAAFVVAILLPEHNFISTKLKLERLGCKLIVHCFALFWKWPKGNLPYYFMDLPHKMCQKADQILEAFDLWDDDESRSLYLAHVRYRMQLDFDGLPVPSTYDQYFPHNFNLTPNEVVVDCGAYDGDTIKSFLQRSDNKVHKLFALEPDPQNYIRLKNYASSLPVSLRCKIFPLPYAVGSKPAKMRFENRGTEGSLLSSSGQIEVESVTLDSLLKTEYPTYIKMDIEGFELPALRGARKLIRRCSPILAICVYHAPNHLWEIPLYVKSLSNNYCFRLRAHMNEGLDLVMYAIPLDRVPPSH